MNHILLMIRTLHILAMWTRRRMSKCFILMKWTAMTVLYIHLILVLTTQIMPIYITRGIGIVKSCLICYVKSSHLTALLIKMLTQTNYPTHKSIHSMWGVATARNGALLCTTGCQMVYIPVRLQEYFISKAIMKRDHITPISTLQPSSTNTVNHTEPCFVHQ